MILMHTDGNLRVHFKCRIHEMAQERLTRIFTGTCRDLHDHGTIRFLRSLKDGLNLLQIVDIKGRHTVVIFCSVIQQLPQGN